MANYTREKLQALVEAYVRQADFQQAVQLEGTPEVAFLAQGEYNLNFLLTRDGQPLVLRLNTGSQMHLTNQIAYEYEALQHLAGSGVTPKPVYLDESCDQLPFGMLVMEFLPGGSLDYRRDLVAGAKVLARVHQVAVPKDHQLIVEERPLSGIWQECATLLPTYLDSPLGQKSIKAFLRRMLAGLAELREQEEEIMGLLPFAIVNTEVNSGNFLVDRDGGRAYLVDWEKPLVTSPLQDLSHFKVPTTTLWKTDYRMDSDDEERFLRAYCRERGVGPELMADLQQALAVFDQFSAMRGISWSAMAWIEYQRPDRVLKNEDTFQKINMYLQEVFLASLFPKFA